jgi:serine/threonine protein phosphatase PrpC
VDGVKSASAITPRLGVVCTTPRDAAAGRRTPSADSYLVAAEGRVTWLDGDAERHAAGRGRGVLLAVADVEGPDLDAARAVAAAAVRVAGRLWQDAVPQDRVDAMARFLVGAHARAGAKTRERAGDAGASLAVAWIDGDELAWARVGTAEVLLLRDGVLRPTARAANPSGRFLGVAPLELVEGRDLGRLKLRAGDEVLVVTDGLLRAVDPVSAREVLVHVNDAQTAAVALMERALARGAADVVTVLVADLRPEGRAAPGTAVPEPRVPPAGSAGPLGSVRTGEPPVRRSGGWRALATSDPG